MQIVHSSNFRKEMPKIFKSILKFGEEVIIPTKEGNIAIISEQELSGLREILYLQSIPGMWESIINGVKEPNEECLSEKDFFNEIEHDI